MSETLFSKKGTGALPSPIDPRDIPASAFQAKVSMLPKSYITDISMLPVADQGVLGSCVGHAIGYGVQLFEFWETKNIVDVSKRFIYGMAKKIDLQPTVQGTYPRVGASVVKDFGCALASDLPNDIKLSHDKYIGFDKSDKILNSAKPRKINGYAFPDMTLEGLKNAIVTNGFFTICLKFGNWTKSPVKPKDNTGYHYIFVFGYREIGGQTRFYFLNSWGNTWEEKGVGYFLWSDYKNAMSDAIIYTDIPDEVIQEFKEKWPYKYFKPTEKTGGYGTCADLDAKVLSFADELRDIIGIPLIPTSGYRPPDYNKKQGGTPNSSHLRRLAIDLSYRTKEERDKILAGIKQMASQGKLCFTEVGKKHIHIDLDPSIHKMGQTIWVDDD